MDTMLYQFLSNRQMTLINMVIGAVLFVLLLIVFFSRTSRDERGRKIIGKASIIALICFGLFATILSHYMQSVAVQNASDVGTVMVNAYLAVNGLQLVYNVTIAIEIIGILLFKRRE